MGGKPRRVIEGAHLHIDGASGCAGDMFLGAMIDLGVPESVIRRSVTALRPGLDIRVAKVVRGGVAATDVNVVSDGAKVEEPYGQQADTHGHDHSHGDEHSHQHSHSHGDDHSHSHGDGDSHRHPHRRYSEIRAEIESASLDPEVGARALDIFDRLARAEAALHGTTIEAVAFHELGALDALADVVGAAAAFEWLAPRLVTAAPVAMGAGRVKTAHGILPVPSPAALRVLRDAGAAIDLRGSRYELCTPTGAAILASIVTHWEPPPPMRPIAIGYGSGDLELADRPNVVRATLGASLVSSGEATDRVLQIECNLDDQSPEIGAHAAALLLEAGALDVWWTPISMKKGRAAHMLSVLVHPRDRAAVLDVVFSETSTLGVRIRDVDRVILERALETVSTPYGELVVKVARRDGEIVNLAPEFESCAAAARASGAPLKAVYAAAVARLDLGSR